MNTQLTIVEIEQCATRLFNAAKSIGDANTVTAAHETAYILAEVRHLPAKKLKPLCILYII